MQSTAPPATFPSAAGAAAAAPPAAIDINVSRTAPHWTAYVSALSGLILLIGGAAIGYEVHNTHIDDSQAHLSETTKDHETRMRVVEQLPGRIAALEEGQKRNETKLDTLISRSLKP